MNFLLEPQGLILAAGLLIGVPAALAMVVGFSQLFGIRAPEARIARGVLGGLTLSLIGALWLSYASFIHDGATLDIQLGSWFRAGQYAFDVSLHIDRLASEMMLLSAVVTLLVAKFSVHYLHRESGFTRYFLLVSVFAAGMQLLCTGGSYDLLFAGWELVGVSSFLLVAFFDDRLGPARGGLRTVLTYRITDIGLLSAGILFHHEVGSSDFAKAFGADGWPHAVSQLPEHGATVVALCLFLSASGKSALVPFSGWLPRAMEGPTPSSALFYGALSVHAGVYLMMRSAPLLEASPLASAVVMTMGAITAVYATMVGRVQSDVKSHLGYATMTQLGLMMVAIGLHWWSWVMFHMAGHIILRAYQMLRVPSALHDTLATQAALGGKGPVRGGLWSRFLPPAALERMRVHAINGFYLDAVLERLVVAPVLAISRTLDRGERSWVQMTVGKHPVAHLAHPPLHLRFDEPPTDIFNDSTAGDRP